MFFLVLMLTLPSTHTRMALALKTPDHFSKNGWAMTQQLVTRMRLTVVNVHPFMLVVDVENPEEFMRQCKANPQVAWVEEDIKIPISKRDAPVNDPFFSKQWTLQGIDPGAMDMAAAWALHNTLGQEPSTAPIIAVMDDGVDLAHPDLNVMQGENFASPDTQEGNGQAQTASEDFHGTMVSGLIAAIGNNNLGIAGVCPVCRILPVRIYGDKTATAQLYITGTEAAAGMAWAVDQGATVINNSWGPIDGNRFLPYHTPTLFPLPLSVKAAIDDANQKGTLVVWAAGNGGESLAYDGFVSYEGVIAVGALAYGGMQARLSDMGDALDFCAPGEGSPTPSEHIFTTDFSGTWGNNTSIGSDGDYYSNFRGTSTSAPLVSGTIALLRLHFPDLTRDQIIDILIRSADKIDTASGTYKNGKSPLYGYGRINPLTALTLAVSNTPLQLDDGSCIPQASGEACNQTDDDCDGYVDEGFVCTPTQRSACAPCTSAGRECATGFICYGTNQKFCIPAPCSDALPCPPGFMCDIPNKRCKFDATQVPNATDCVDYYRRSPQNIEFCDGIDNDVDSHTDEFVTDDPAVTRETTQCRVAAIGICAQAIAACAQGHWECVQAANHETVETQCDDVDNDCDGRTDESEACKSTHGCGSCAASTHDYSMTPWLLALVFAAHQAWRLTRSQRDDSPS